MNSGLRAISPWIERLMPALLGALVMLSWGTRAAAECGGGVIDGVETCDDGNTTDGDGCTVECQIEAGFVCNGVPSLCCFADAALAYAVSGSAYIDGATGEITLTQDRFDQAGYAWFRQRISFANDFSIDFKLYLGAEDAGADGGSIIFQRDERGLAATGSGGGDLGATGITPLVAVEFDDFDNTSIYGDLAADHVSIFQSSPLAANQLAPSVCMDADCRDFEDGSYHSYAIDWSSTDKIMTVTIDGQPRIELPYDFAAGVFDGDPGEILFGFAASTGEAKNEQKICPSAPAGFIVPRDFDGDLVDDSTDVDDDNDGVLDTDEANVFGSDDPGGDHDTDGTPNWKDTSYWTGVLSRAADCPDVSAPIGECDTAPLGLDRDGDGIPNHHDGDSDGDGVADAIEVDGVDANADEVADGCTPVQPSGACAGPSRAPRDSDNDGVLDPYDSDSDDDGLLDGPDPARTNACSPATEVVQCGTGDSDDDGVSNGVECPTPSAACADVNDDGTANYLDPCVPAADAVACASGDFDGDGTSNGEDPSPRNACAPDAGDPACATADRDRDGVQNGSDSAPEDPCVPNDQAAACPNGDSDGDGIDNDIDSAPRNVCAPNPNALACVSGDADRDGVTNGADAAPSDPCLPQRAALACADGDADDDGVENSRDLDPADACKPSAVALACASGDTDRDGVDNADDESGSDPCIPEESVVTCARGDRDGDGIPNGVECRDTRACADTDRDGLRDYEDEESDGDGIPDATECADGDECRDSDDDGAPDRIDSDDDEDGILTLDEDVDGDNDRSNDDLDEDGVPAYLDDSDAPRDRDNDGVPDREECGKAESCRDTDRDGTPDDLDADDDADGIGSIIERAGERKYGRDFDRDGVPNHLDRDADGDRIPDRYESRDADSDGVPDYLQKDTLTVRGGACSAAAGGDAGNAPWLVLAALALLRRPRRPARSRRPPAG